RYIDLRGIEEVDAQVQGAMQAAHGLGIVYLAPGAADGPGAEADAGDFEAGTAERFVLHGCFIPARRATCQGASVSKCAVAVRIAHESTPDSPTLGDPMQRRDFVIGVPVITAST